MQSAGSQTVGSHAIVSATLCYTCRARVIMLMRSPMQVVLWEYTRMVLIAVLCSATFGGFSHYCYLE